nr:uncharacterized protein LOC111416693 [Onthophagus taurus]
MNIDTERLITEVRLQPQLWDLSHNLYKDRDARLKGWLEVCQTLFPNWGDLSDGAKKDIDRSIQQRWKTANDRYVRCRNTLKNTRSGAGGGKLKKYVYFDLMEFLDKHHAVGIEDSLQKSQSTITNMTPRSETIEDTNVITTALPTMSTTSNTQNSISSSTEGTSQITSVIPPNFPGTKRNRLKRNKNDAENDEFEREMVKMFKDNTAMLQNDDMAFFASLLPITKNFTIQQKLHFRSEVIKIAMEITNNSTLNVGYGHPGSSTDSYGRPESSISSIILTSPASQATIFADGGESHEIRVDEHSNMQIVSVNSNSDLSDYLNLK